MELLKLCQDNEPLNKLSAYVNLLIGEEKETGSADLSMALGIH
jgi:hypothetical protein